MSRLKLYLLALTALVVYSVKADEGIWLLQLMQEQHSIDMTKKQGLRLEAQDLYSPNGVSLKDTVGIFDGGCTGEVISPERLMLTNHHYGYASTQRHSSVGHDYLTDGFWVTSRDKELPTPGLGFTFIEHIEDITNIVDAKIAAEKITETESFSSASLNKLAKELLEKSDLKGKKGIAPQALPFYAENKFYMFYKKVYPDVRVVATPPSSIGKFGGGAGNWIWPRHTDDFSMFGTYTDTNGEPTECNAPNVLLKARKHLNISIKRLKEGDCVMIMGFPGSTSHCLTVSEVKKRTEASNAPRIRTRGTRQDVLKEAMNTSDKVRIQCASKYIGSSNYQENSVGVNKAIIDNNVLDTKADQEAKFARFAKEKNNTDYMQVVSKINETVSRTSPIKYRQICLTETFFGGIKFGSPYLVMDKLKEALEQKNDSNIQVNITVLKEVFDNIHNKDYDHEVDRKITKALLPLYAEMVPAGQRPAIYEVIEKEYKGDYNAYVDAIYDASILTNQSNFGKFVKKPTVKAIEKDITTQYSRAKFDKYTDLAARMDKLPEELTSLHKACIRGLDKMKLPTPFYPGADFTVRLTYGNVKPYSPKDGVYYKYYTTADRAPERENPEDREFVVPAKLKELIEKKDLGHYTLPNGEMPVCFLSTNDITSGNSENPVLNENGELIGCTLDGNWEPLSGDINFNNNLQRCINLDIHYVLFILEKLGGCGHLINEMTIVE